MTHLAQVSNSHTEEEVEVSKRAGSYGTIIEVLKLLTYLPMITFSCLTQHERAEIIDIISR